MTGKKGRSTASTPLEGVFDRLRGLGKERPRRKQQGTSRHASAGQPAATEHLQ